MTKKILILGGSSFIGSHFRGILGKRVIPTYNSRKIPGGLKFDAVKQNLADVIKSPEIFEAAIILLGDTHPDSCAKDKIRSRKLNVESMIGIIKVLKKWQLPLIFTSTEFVFDGLKGNYSERVNPNPILTYGRQKLEVEKFIQENCHSYIIVRLGKVYGSDEGDGTIFTNWLKQIRTEKNITVAADQVFSPVFVDDVISAVLVLLEKKAWGLYHLGNDRGFSRRQLLELLMQKMGKKIKITGCSIDDFPLIEKRPKNVSMNTAKIRKVKGIHIRPIGEVLDLIIKKQP